MWVALCGLSRNDLGWASACVFATSKTPLCHPPPSVPAPASPDAPTPGTRSKAAAPVRARACWTCRYWRAHFCDVGLLALFKLGLLFRFLLS